jgi:hypothetical protein
MRIHRLLPASALIGLLAGCTVPPPHGGGSGQGTVEPLASSTDQGGAAGSMELTGSGASKTSVGARAAELGQEVDELDQSANLCSVTEADIKTQRAQLSTNYFTTVAQIDARLEAGTTAGNPELAAAWQAARGSLGSLDREAERLRDLVTSCTDDTAQASYLTQSIHAAMSLRGAVDADRAELIRQSGRVGAISSNLELTLGLLLDDLNRQNEMLLVEHRNLTTLAHAIDVGQLLGGNLGLKASPLPGWSAPSSAPVPLRRRPATLSSAPQNRSLAAGSETGEAAAAEFGLVRSAGPTETAAPSPGIHKHRHHPILADGGLSVRARFHHHRLLLVVPLGESDGYEHALYNVVNAVLTKRPDARFVIEASVRHNPNRSLAVLDASAAQHQSDAVARSLAAFGLPQTRVTTLSPVAGGGGAIRVWSQ